jgi:hypothetical protein
VSIVTLLMTFQCQIGQYQGGPVAVLCYVIDGIV